MMVDEIKTCGDQISFKNLGIFFKNVGKGISIGPVTLAYYGIIIAVGVLLALYVVRKRVRETGQNEDDYTDIAFFTVVFGIIGARVYYVLFSWSYYRDHLSEIINIREGGLAIYGGIIFGVITICICGKIKKIRFGTLLDTAALAVPVGQILGRLGNFFNREAFGGYSDGLFAMQIPVGEVRPGEITEEMAANLVDIDGVRCISVHPTFLYESVWNILLLIFLFLMRNRLKRRGSLFALYALGYGIGRFFIERLRTDQLLIPGTSVPVSMAVSVVAAVAGAGYIVYGHFHPDVSGGKEPEETAKKA